MGTHVPYGITQCYLPPGRVDIPVFIPAEAGTQFNDPRIDAKLIWPSTVMVEHLSLCVLSVPLMDSSGSIQRVCCWVPLGKRYRSIAVAVLWVRCSRQQAVVLSSKCEQRTPGFVNVHESPGIKKSNFPGPGKSWNQALQCSRHAIQQMPVLSSKGNAHDAQQQMRAASCSKFSSTPHYMTCS